MSTGRRLTRLGALVAGIALIGVVSATEASAHVTVAAPGVTVGQSDATINFRVPTESATASTVGLKLQFPTTTPIAGVLVLPQPGWTAVIKQTKLTTPIKTDDGDITQIVSEIDWTADSGNGIKPGYFGQFTVIGGALPDDVDTLTFKAIQQYSDGSIVSWTDIAAPGSTTEPDHPAPTLHLAAATTGPAPSTAPVAASDSASKGSATTGIILGAIGVVLGAGALVLTLLRGRRTSAG